MLESSRGTAAAYAKRWMDDGERFAKPSIQGCSCFREGHGAIHADARCRQTPVAYHGDNSACSNRGWHRADCSRCPISAGVRGWTRSRGTAYPVLGFADWHVGDFDFAGRSDSGVLRPRTTSIRCRSLPSCVWISASYVPQGPHLEVEAGGPSSGSRFRLAPRQIGTPSNPRAACREPDRRS
jgi:hypothetical protein